MDLTVVGVNHRTAPVEVREALAVPRERFGEVLDSIACLPGVREAALLSTCNRVEVYVVAERPLSAAALVAPLFGDRAWRLPQGRIERCLYAHAGVEAARHLLRVASGLDSLIVGECQILGQVKEAYEQSRHEERTGPILNVLFQRAIHAAKAVHSETGISQGKSSVASVALDFMSKVFASLAGKTVMLVGAGQTAELALERLRRHEGVRVLVANRCLEKARNLAARIAGTAVPLAQAGETLPEADIVICATASERPLVGVPDVLSALRRRGGRPMCLIDLSVPRNVDPLVSTVPNAYLFDLDDLQEEVARTQTSRRGESARGEELLLEEVGELWPQLEERLANGGRAKPRSAAAAHAPLARG